MAHDYTELELAWGDWIAGIGNWTLFGGETFDQKRRRLQPVRTRTVEAVQHGVNASGYPRWFWGSPVSYSYVLDAPKQVSRDVAIRKFERFVRRAERHLQRPVDYVCALQYQKNGWPHFHPLLDTHGLVGNEIGVLSRLWREEAGGCELSVPRDGEAVSRYACRYASRDLADCDVLFGSRLRCSDAVLLGRMASGVAVSSL